MPSSDYAEVALGNDRPLSASVRESRGFALCASFESMGLENSAVDSFVGRSARRSSALQQWCEAPFVETSGEGKRFVPSPPHSTLFSINEVMLQVVQTLHETDVVCLIAPTGSGKSLLAPFIAEQLALRQYADFGNYGEPFKLEDVKEKGYRKSLLVAPNAEHVGSTARCFKKLFSDSHIRVSAFFNPYVERKFWNERTSNLTSSDASSEFAITSYNAAIRVLPHADLNLLILDEVHDPNDNVQVTMAMALKMLLASPFDPEKEKVSTRKLNKLLLMTATLDDEEKKRYEEYFTSHCLSFKLLDFTDNLERRKKLTMSCLYTLKSSPGTQLPEMFKCTPMSNQLAKEFKAKGYRYSDHNLEELHNRMRDSLDYAMGLACENLRSRLERLTGDYDMQSIIVILPGMDQVDKMYSAAFKLANFNFDGQPGFHPVRLTSLVKDDELITTECYQRGNWTHRGHLGRIVLTTNLVAAGLTVPNAAYVIDSGLQKMLREYTRDGLRSLETTMIDRLMIVQRAGRTGRTTDGEYFLPYSVEAVNEMMKSNHGELLVNRNFEERHLLYKRLYELQLLHEPPKRLKKELQKSMEIRGLYVKSDGFPEDVILMNSLFNFLPTEFARIVIQGTQLGIAAHAILLVAEITSRVKFCRVGLPGSRGFLGPSDIKSAVHLYCEAMDAKRFNKRIDLASLPQKYRGVGDSIALSDLLASFFSFAPDQLNRSALDSIPVKPCNFWSGREGGVAHTLADLYPAFVKDEGRDAISRYVYQIESALLAADLIPARGIFDPRLNRHIITRDNFCLDENGRALLAALLTMHSSRVGEQTWREQQARYKIYRDKPDETEFEFLHPESSYSQPKVMKAEDIKKAKNKNQGGNEEGRRQSEMIYGRFTEMFERRGQYSGLIDPITLKQMTFLLNINGENAYRNDSSSCSLKLKLNAATGSRGIKILLNESSVFDVGEVRSALARGLTMLTHTRDESLITDLEKFIVTVWKECESKMKLEEISFSDNPPPPDKPDNKRIKHTKEREMLKEGKKDRERKKMEKERNREEMVKTRMVKDRHKALGDLHIERKAKDSAWEEKQKKDKERTRRREENR